MRPPTILVLVLIAAAAAACKSRQDELSALAQHLCDLPTSDSSLTKLEADNYCDDVWKLLRLAANDLLRDELLDRLRAERADAKSAFLVLDHAAIDALSRKEPDWRTRGLAAKGGRVDLIASFQEDLDNAHIKARISQRVSTRTRRLFERLAIERFEKQHGGSTDCLAIAGPNGTIVGCERIGP